MVFVNSIFWCLQWALWPINDWDYYKGNYSLMDCLCFEFLFILFAVISVYSTRVNNILL